MNIENEWNKERRAVSVFCFFFFFLKTLLSLRIHIMLLGLISTVTAIVCFSYVT